jgi:F-type H+-transporting ATPase subunit delta
MPTEIESEVAQRYAQALFEVSHESGRLDDDLAQARLLRYLVSHARDFLDFLSAPHIDAHKKFDFIQRTLGTRLSTTMIRLIEILTREGRITVLPEVLEEFGDLVDISRGIRDALVRTAFALDDAEKARLKATLEQFFTAKLRIQYIVEPELIGGIIYQSEDTMIDASIRGELSRLKAQLEQASLAGASQESA